MAEHPNLSDPDFEPTDEQLEGLWSRAMEQVNASRARAMEKLRQDIADARARALRHLASQTTPSDRK